MVRATPTSPPKTESFRAARNYSVRGVPCTFPLISRVINILVGHTNNDRLIPFSRPYSTLLCIVFVRALLHSFFLLLHYSYTTVEYKPYVGRAGPQKFSFLDPPFFVVPLNTFSFLFFSFLSIASQFGVFRSRETVKDMGLFGHKWPKVHK
jgi:hypothetical protein